MLKKSDRLYGNIGGAKRGSLRYHYIWLRLFRGKTDGTFETYSMEQLLQA